MTCRIDRLLIEGDLVVLRISGRLTGDNMDVLRAAIEQERGAVAIDLEEVGLVDRGAVTLLALSEAKGIALSNCPPVHPRMGRPRASARRPGLFGARDMSKTAPHGNNNPTEVCHECGQRAI